MSYISISTNQPSEGQRDLTERQPANLRNDFKVPIEIHNGDTIELVSLKFNIGEIVITGDNNKIVWSVGQQPFATYHTALIPIGSYPSPEALATEIARGFNASTLLPSYQPLPTNQNPYNFSNIPGWTCTWTPPVGASGTTPAKIGFFTIKANQCEGPDSVVNKTFGQVARASYVSNPNRAEATKFAVNEAVITRSSLPSVARIDIIERAPNDLVTSSGIVAVDEQVWAQKKWDCVGDAAEELASSMFALAIDDTGDTLEEYGLTNGENVDGFDFFFHSGTNQSGNTGGHSYETSRIANTIIPTNEIGGPESGTFYSELGGIFNNGGVIRTEVHPIIGYNIADFTTSAAATANFIGQTVTMQLRGYTFAGDPGLIQRDFLVAAVAPGSNNDWSIKLTTTTPFDATGDGNPEVDTVLWMAYVDDLVDAEYGPLKTYFNGMFALGFTPGGGTSAPPDASNRANHNAFADPSNERARNYWYYDADAQDFKCAFRQKVIGSGPTGEDGYTRPIRTPFVVNGLIEPAIRMYALDGAGVENPMGIIPTQPLGYPACKVGLNRRARITEDFAKINLNKFAGLESLSDSYIGNPFDEACEYSISINNGNPGPPGPESVEIHAPTGARIPIIRIVNPKSFQRFIGTGNTQLGEKLPAFGDNGWIRPNVAEVGRFTDTAKFPTLGAFDPTKSLLLEISLEKNNEIKYSIAQITPTTVVTANPFPAAPVLTGNIFTYALPIAVADNDTGVRLMESHFPLCPTIQLGGGGYYGLSGPTGTGNFVEEKIGAAFTVDMSGPYRESDLLTVQQNPRLAFKDAYPDTAIKQQFSVTGGQVDDVVTTIASNSYNAMNQIAVRKPSQLDRESIEFYNNAPATPANGLQSTLFRENGEAIRDLRANSGAFGLPGLEIQRLNGGGGAVPPTQFISTDKITTSGIETGVSVNILSGNIKGYNGGTSDINKAVCFLQPEQLQVNLDGSQRTFFHESKTSRPVEFNVPTTHITQSMTVQLKNGNNELVQGLQAPVEVILYKKSRDNELREIRAVLEGMKSDKQEYKIQTAGIDNPLLGVIPR